MLLRYSGSIGPAFIVTAALILWMQLLIRDGSIELPAPQPPVFLAAPQIVPPPKVIVDPPPPPPESVGSSAIVVGRNPSHEGWWSQRLRWQQRTPTMDSNDGNKDDEFQWRQWWSLAAMVADSDSGNGEL